MGEGSRPETLVEHHPITPLEECARMDHADPAEDGARGNIALTGNRHDAAKAGTVMTEA